ncbi:Hypothetical protein NTJ_07658 [Nesidiocoris tenuis]|uniref:Secreted protein n=1 Tax=Nesidiocoris tenuis TaxID=355587 RepID=A0ABN7ATN6_9HEMI|nr:Hypothetical protein NTJ_07658 [Nesidiocoris tenuis]
MEGVQLRPFKIIHLLLLLLLLKVYKMQKSERNIVVRAGPCADSDRGMCIKKSAGSRSAARPPLPDLVPCGVPWDPHYHSSLLPGRDGVPGIRSSCTYHALCTPALQSEG